MDLRTPSRLLNRLAEKTAQRWGARADQRALPFGVNVSGYFASEKGVGEGARADVHCLRAAGVPHALNDYADTHGSANIVKTTWGMQGDNPYRYNLIHVNADQAHVFAGKRPATYFEGRYNIGFWVWELSDFPARWQSCFSYFDEIWTPSQFSQDAIARVAPIPVVRFPHAISAPSGEVTPWPRRDLELPEDAFVFFFMFDCYSVVERKNPFGLVEAFRRAFSPRDRAWLLLKCSHQEHAPDTMHELRRAIGDANVRLIDRVVERSELDSMMATVDCYASLHRSEGFGITVAEAMAMGKPVITTAFSGTADFANASNSLPVRFELQRLQRDHGPYEKGSVWAQPDVEQAARHMRALFDDRALARKIGDRGRKWVRTWLSPERIGNQMKARLRLLDRTLDIEGRRWPGPRRIGATPTLIGRQP